MDSKYSNMGKKNRGIKRRKRITLISSICNKQDISNYTGINIWKLNRYIKKNNLPDPSVMTFFELLKLLADLWKLKTFNP
jgi:hypothetical protein